MSYTHITSSNQNELAVLLRTKIKKKEIARLLKKDRTTIWRERKRNEDKNGKYYARKAKERTRERQENARQKQRKIENSRWLQNHIEVRIKKRWSPEQISGRLKRKYPNDKKKVSIYFAFPYHSWERGCNENSNGLLRQYFPKKTPLGKVTQREIDTVVREINNRPRKRLGYRTPYEVFYEKN